MVVLKSVAREVEEYEHGSTLVLHELQYLGPVRTGYQVRTRAPGTPGGELDGDAVDQEVAPVAAECSRAAASRRAVSATAAIGGRAL
jgi:hypothetical protein